ncbi:M48 family metalloprotease [Streptomyces sp. NPDC048340]|uniref:M48 family metalloprotease n=1 Tax=Streptomyces sp. NPDC048340 TaxID=3365537 RepID=UPI003714E680
MREPLARQDQRVLGQGSTRRSALFLLALLVVAVGLRMRSARARRSGALYEAFLATPEARGLGGLPLRELRPVRPRTAAHYGRLLADAALPPALWAGAVLAAAALLLFLVTPAWRRWTGRMVPVGRGSALDLALRGLCLRSGVQPLPRFLVAPLRMSATAVTFGAAGRYTVCVNAGLRPLLTSDPRHFEAVVLHELAHIRNRDVELGCAARALWWAFLLTVAVPHAILTYRLAAAPAPWPGEGLDPGGEAELLALLAALAYATHTEILRSRELCADLDAVDQGADPAVWERPVPWWRWVTLPWHTHPSWPWRRRALARPVQVVGSYATWEQPVLLVGWVVVLLQFALNEFGGATVPTALCYAGLVLCGWLGRMQSRHPNSSFRVRPRTFGTDAGTPAGTRTGIGIDTAPGPAGRLRRTAVPALLLLALLVVDPVGSWLTP